MSEAIRKLMMLGLGSSMIMRMADQGGGEPIGVIELEGNLADAEKPPEVKAGVYAAEIQGVEEKISGAGNTYFAVKCVIPPEELPADMRDMYDDGAILYWNRLIKPRDGADRRAIYNLRKFVEAVGLETNTTSIDPNDWMGQRVSLRVRQTTYQGELRAEIAAVEAAEAEQKSAGRGKRQEQEEEKEPAPKGGRNAKPTARRGR